MHCTENLVSVRWCAGSASAERVGQGEVGRVIYRVLCTRQLLGLAVKGPWLAPGGPILAPGCMNRLRKRYSHLLGGSFLARKASWAPSWCLPTESADYCMFVNEWAWLRSQVCLLSLKVHLDSFWESELRQKRRYGALQACVC